MPYGFDQTTKQNHLDDAKNEMRLPAKLMRPRLFGTLARTRLFTLLDERRKHTATWVNGPPGSGKTTLVASYVEARKQPTVWYQVDGGDADPATFFYYLHQAVTHDMHREDITLPLLTPEYLPDLAGFARRFFRALFSYLPADAMLVFDDMHQVTASSAFFELLEHAMGETPDGANIIFVSRTEPPQAFLRAIASQRLVAMGWEDLALSLEETRAIVTGAGGVSDDRIAALHARCDGWAAGLTLMLAGRSRTGNIELSTLTTQEMVFNYFAAEIFARLPNHARDVLMRIAFLPTITEYAAIEISGSTHAPEVLNHLYRHHYFTDRRNGQQVSYVFHALFREFLLNRTRQVISAEECTRLSQRGAHLLEREGRVEDAAALYIESCAWLEVGRLVCQQGPALVAQGRGALLESWVNPIPETMLDALPWLHYWRGLARLPFNPPASRPCFERAFSLFKTQDEAAGMYLTLAAMLDSLFYTGSLLAADPWIEELDQLLVRHPHPPSPEVEAHLLAAMNCILFRCSQHPALRAMAERAQALLEILPDPLLRLRVANFAVGYRLFMGEFAQAGIIIDSVKSVLAQRLPPLAVMIWKGCIAAYGWHTASHEFSLKMVDEAMHLAEVHGIHIMTPLACSQGVYASLSMGDVVRAETYLAKIQNSPLPLGLLDICQNQIMHAGLLLVRGDAHAAAATLTANMPLAEETGWLLATALAHIYLAQALIELGDHTGARRELNLAQQFVDEFPSHILKFVILRVTAQSFFATGEEEVGLAALRQGFKIACEQGYMNCHPWWLPKVMSRLCAKALDAGIEIPYVRTLIKYRDLLPETLDVEQWPWKIKIYTLDRFTVLIDDLPLSFEGKTQKKPLELLKALIASGGRGIGVQGLVDALWQDADGDAGKRSFEITLHRLRKLIGTDALILEDGRLTLATSHAWVDAWAFERRAGRLDVATSKHPAHIAQHTDALYALYRAPFLCDVTAAWALPMRERLRSRFLRNVYAAGEHWARTAQWNVAATLYARAIDIDPYAEELYCRLMLAYRHLNRRADALATYRRCENTLASAHGMVPGRDTKALRDSLLAH